MTELLTLQNLLDLGMLLFLQAVLGFDNLLYISIESKRAPAAAQAKVRRHGILIALALRIVLLFVIMRLLASLTQPWFGIHWPGVFEAEFNFAALVFLLGGVFIMYTAVKEIAHMIAVEDLQNETSGKPAKPALQVLATIVLMNLVFSFDSILSALAISEVFAVLATAIIASAIAMLVLADHVAEFLERNRKYEVLGLFILLIVGVVLLGEGGHVAHMEVFGQKITPMSKATFYFSIVVLVAVDIIQSLYDRKLKARKAAAAAAGKTT